MSLVNHFKWTAIDKFSTFFIQILGNLMLARMLSPSDFGIIAIPMIIYSLGLIFSEAGITNYIIKNETVDSKLASNLHWFAIFVAILFGVLSFVFSRVVITLFFNDIYFIELLCYCILVVFQSAASVPLALLMRNFRFKEISIIRILSVTLALVLTFVISFFLKNHYLIIVYYGLIVVIRLITIKFFINFPSFTIPNLRLVKNPIYYSFPIVVAALIHDAYKHFQTFIVAKSFSLKTLGDWNQSRTYNDSFNGLFISIITQILLPFFSEKKRKMSENEFTSYFLHNFSLFFSIITFIYSFVIIFCNEIVTIVLGYKWINMAYLLVKLIAVSGYFSILNGYILTYFKTNNSTMEILQSEISKKIFAVLLVFTFSYFYGINGLIIGLGINSFIEFIINSIFLAKKSKTKPRRVIYANISLLIVNYPFILAFLFLEIYYQEILTSTKVILFIGLLVFSGYSILNRSNNFNKIN